jgi:hypothetical protein
MMKRYEVCLCVCVCVRVFFNSRMSAAHYLETSTAVLLRYSCIIFFLAYTHTQKSTIFANFPYFLFFVCSTHATKHKHMQYICRFLFASTKKNKKIKNDQK